MKNFLLGISVGLVVVLLTFFVFWRFFLQTTISTPITAKATPIPSTVSAKNTKRIAYVKDNQIWLINSDGSEKKQLTFDPGVSYQKLAFKTASELSFLKCVTSCQLVTKNIETGAETPNTTDGDVLAFGWSGDAKSLAYVFQPSREEMQLILVSGDMGGIIKNFSVPNIGGGGRGGSLDDDISVQFSPDNARILVVNTLTQPNINDKATLWIFDQSGEQTTSLLASDNIWPTQAFWDSEKRQAFFKMGANFEWIDSDQHTGGTYFNPEVFYNPTLLAKTAGETEFLYWAPPKGTNKLPLIGKFDTKTNSAIITGYFKPKSLFSPAKVLALKAVEVPKGQEAMFPFVSAGLSIIDVSTKEVKDIDQGDVSDFAVQP